MSVKNYIFNNENDFLYYIHHLIIGISKTLDSYEDHISMLKDYIEEMKLIKEPKRVVSSEVYDKFKAMLSDSINRLSNLFGDQAEFGSSYQNYRKNIKKKSKKLNLSYVEFTQEQEEELNKVTTSRNWANHIPVSLIHSTRFKAFNEKIDTSKPIHLAYFENYQSAWLTSLYEQSYNSLQAYKKLFDLLKEDYVALTGVPCIIKRIVHPVRDISDLNIPRISFEIQSKKIRSHDEIKDIYNKK